MRGNAQKVSSEPISFERPINYFAAVIWRSKHHDAAEICPILWFARYCRTMMPPKRMRDEMDFARSWVNRLFFNQLIQILF